MRNFYAEISLAIAEGKRLLAILIDPDKFIEAEAELYLEKLPIETTHILVGGSTVEKMKTEKTVKAIKAETDLPVILFPGDYSQITETADALLFLSLISGRNPEYLIEQQVKSVEKLKNSKLEIIPTAYILIDGGKECAVQRVSGTKPIPQSQVDTIVNTALAGEFSGKKLIYLEAGSGADFPVSEEIIAEVKKAVSIPLIVGGGIRSLEQQKKAYKAGADMIVMGTQFEN
ncbi:geranylgeranylglyceryl/heptaprenylglyceryl phosphate synthase [Salegentibacter sp. LM13S]|uniref:geranylgeranylglyceryl/heptaprenylglyceryl phosphate synthase n=1 Tax=Salegentibacter lacus TaxID=2873599 RepID=UPI001CCA1A51|nr:geranylgeranylglyceryl/heptaprenylglyceryl phosphate synthase [Salegentibacter lacus]MBZ9631072.1 geranylgeranylglyceryl/heptaprenylglyceryl phosphate synthase [Salegentibacter lacus]